MSSEKSNHPPRQTLRLETLEAREVPASFGSTRGGLSVAIGDVLPGDSQNEYITGTGPGRPGLVRVWSLQGALRQSITPFGNFSGGVYVATGDVDLDGNLELITSTAPGTTGRVKVYAFRNGGLQQLASFMPFGPNYSGGVQIATGNVTGGLAREIIVGRESGSPTVKVYSYDPTVSQAFEIRSFQAYGGNYHGGVTVSSGNIDIQANSILDPYNYNYAEIITGRTASLPQVKVFDVQTPTAVTRASYMAYDTNLAFNRQGINVTVGNTDGRRGVEVYVALRNSGTIRVFNGWNGGFITQVRPFPPTYSRSVNMYIGHGDDDFGGVFGVADLIVVSGEGPFQQVPLVYYGKLNSPAGLNGVGPAA